MTRSLAESLHGHSPEQWAHDFLQVAGFPITAENMRVVVSWEYAESGGGGGFYNPLNTTQPGFPGSTDFNSVGVKNFRTYGDGVAANAKVIHNGYYKAAVAAFERGNDAEATVRAITSSPWGTRHIVLRGAAPLPPKPRKVDMALVASPHKPTKPGRVAAARWSADAPNLVVLTNGARIKGDKAWTGGGCVWVPPVAPGRTGVGIMATVGRRGRTDGRGIILQDDAGNTYIGDWA